MFCFLADVEIHRRTGNRLGLQDAMRAVVRASGGLSSDWPISRVFEIADQATGTKVLEEMYAQMRDEPVTPDLQDLWAKLGVVSDGGSVKLHDDAPLAAIRLAIMKPHGAATPAPAKRT
jgi:predicted metalloprotease with PDZ domain